jgi:hypothetical protein
MPRSALGLRTTTIFIEKLLPEKNIYDQSGTSAGIGRGAQRARLTARRTANKELHQCQHEREDKKYGGAGGRKKGKDQPQKESEQKRPGTERDPSAHLNSPPFWSFAEKKRSSATSSYSRGEIW